MPRPKLCKFADKYTGWLGEGCWTAYGRRWIKRLQRRHNRHYWNAQTRATQLNSSTTA